jgi:hypothetical protein
MQIKNIAKYIYILFFCCSAFNVNAQNDAQHSKDVDPFIQSCVAEINSDSLYSYVLSLQSFNTRYCLADNRKDVAFWIAGKLESFGYQTKIDSFISVYVIHMNTGGYDFHITKMQYSVIGTLWGNQNPSEIYIAGAHYDSYLHADSILNPMIFAPGADDDASGVAAILEIARVFKKLNYIPSSTLEFIAFASEELMNSSESGAEHYAYLCDSLNKDIRLMINGDMLGNPRDSTNTLNIIGYTGDEWISAHADSLRQDYCTINGAVYNGQEIWDAYPFWEKSFPSIGFADRGWLGNPNYHSATDIIENLNFYYFTEATRLIFALLLDQVPASTFNINENNLKYNVVIYPNPCTNHLWLKFNTNEENCPFIFEVQDEFGRIIKKF